MTDQPRSLVTINSVEIKPIVVRDQHVLTLAMIDKVHSRPEGTARRNFTENKSRLIEGQDYFVITRESPMNEIRPLGNIPPKGVTLVTESGYLLLVKSFTDDLAWQIQRELVNVYFRAKTQPVIEHEAPAFELTPSPSAKPPQINQQARILADTLGSMVKIAKLCGLKGNQAVLSADRGTQEWAGVSPLKLLGLTHLMADPRGQIYTPTDLGEMLVPPIKGAAMNRLLETHGLQTRDTTGEWIPTAAAEGLHEWSDTHKRHSNGTPIKQLRWFVTALDRLGVEYRINGGAE